MPWGIPVRPQTGPRHRSQVHVAPMQAAILGLKPRASVIQTEQPLVFVDDIPKVVGHCDLSLVSMIAGTILRAREAERFERRMTQCR